MLLFSQVDMSWIPTITQLATGGGFAVLVWFLIMKQIPAMNAEHASERKLLAETHKEERQQERHQYLAALERRDARFDALIEKHHEIAKQYHESASQVASRLAIVEDRLEKLSYHIDDSNNKRQG